MGQFRGFCLSVAIVGVVAVALSACSTEEPAATAVPQEPPTATVASIAPPPPPTPTHTPQPTATPLASPTPTSTLPPTYTPRPPSPTPTATLAPTYTPLPTYTPRPTHAPRPTWTPGPTATPSAKQMAQAAIAALPWVADSVDSSERSAHDALSRLAGRNPEETLLISNMPFLESIEPADATAVQSLYRLARWADDGDFERIMGHKNIADGIDDEEAKVVAVIYGVNRYRPDSVDFLLRGTGVYLEERTIELAHSGETQLTIIRIRNQTTSSMDLLEHSVRTIEEFMAAPLPTNYVALIYEDATRSGTGGGNNFGTHMTMALRYDVDGGGRNARYNSHTIPHEVAHYYWTGNVRWINEGVAEILGSISQSERIGAPIGITNRPCASARTIRELDALEAEPGSNASRCFYSLGEALLLDLYQQIGDDSFRQGLRNLYRQTLADDPADSCRGTKLGICHLEAAFKDGVSPEVAAKVDEIVGKWYYGNN